MNEFRVIEDPSNTQLERLIATALRPEFDTLLITPPSGDAALGLLPCRVDGCVRGMTTHEMCGAHHTRWAKAGRPELEAWIRTPQSPIRRPEGITACLANGCQRASSAAGLCARHNIRWKRDGKPSVADWATAQESAHLGGLQGCAVDDCELDAESPIRPLCSGHRDRWRHAGKPPIDKFLDMLAKPNIDAFDLRSLPPRLAQEIQYGLQCRSDEKRLRTIPRRLMPLIRFLEESDTQSLRERPLSAWTTTIEEIPRLGWPHTHVSFVRDCLEYFERLEGAVGWDFEYPKDIWKLKNVGYPHERVATLRFDRIRPKWMREATKRWCRWRLSTGSGANAVAANLYAVTRFGQFLESTERQPPDPSELDRDFIEEYLAWISIECPDPRTRRKDLGGVASFLRTLQQHRWVPGLSPEAMIFNEDYPAMPDPQPRALSEFVASQLELESNLSRFEEFRFRVLTEILQRTGLRVGDARQIEIDCLEHDQHGAAYLRYHNHKMKRDARTPIDNVLAASIAEQQDFVRERYPDGPVLFPMVRNNPGGIRSISRTAYAQKLNEWIEVCGIRTAVGDAAHVHPHQFRHTYATRLINSGVPQHVVKKLLDHDSDTMTAHYARLSLETVREEWSKATKVDIAGHEIHEGDGALADAIWLKNSLSRTKMALPNGFCTLPLQQTCEYANACLTCPMFLTTPEFLPQHKSQLIETQALVKSARQNGRERLAEMNQKVERNLLNIIGSLETSRSACCSPEGTCSCHRDVVPEEGT